jgi:hypothetical protein
MRCACFLLFCVVMVSACSDEGTKDTGAQPAGGDGGAAGIGEAGVDASAGAAGVANASGQGGVPTDASGFGGAVVDASSEGGNAGQAGAPNTDPIDLRDYFPSAQTTVRTRLANGSTYGTYAYLPATTDFLFLYDTFFSLGKPGDLFLWAKGYGDEGCIATYAHFFLGDDGSFTEVGDYLANDGCHPSVVFGYGDSVTLANDGLAWSAAGGLPLPSGTGQPAQKMALQVRRQNNPGDPYVGSSARAWNHTAVVEVLSSFRPAYGRSPEGVWGKDLGRTYDNVLRLVFYHGTQLPGHQDIVCPTDDTWPHASFYYHLPGYHTYASEFYLAPGSWIIQESFLYTESGGYWGIPNCVGLGLDKNPAWVSYIDDP